MASLVIPTKFNPANCINEINSSGSASVLAVTAKQSNCIITNTTEVISNIIDSENDTVEGVTIYEDN